MRRFSELGCFKERLEKLAAYTLSKEEEWALIERARKGDGFAKMKLERELMSYFKQSLNGKRRSNSLLGLSGYVNAITRDLPKYIQDYDPKKGVSFKVYVEQHASGTVQNLNNSLVPGSTMNRNERPLQAKYNMAKQHVESMTPGGKASDKDILARIKETHGETWDATKLNVAKKLNVTNLRTNYEVENADGDAVSHRDQFAGGGVKGEAYYQAKERSIEIEEKARFTPELTEAERRIVLSFIKTKSKVKTSFETNETVYNVNKALKKFDGLID